MVFISRTTVERVLLGMNDVLAIWITPRCIGLQRPYERMNISSLRHPSASSVLTFHLDE